MSSHWEFSGGRLRVGEPGLDEKMTQLTGVNTILTRQAMEELTFYLLNVPFTQALAEVIHNLHNGITNKIWAKQL